MKTMKSEYQSPCLDIINILPEAGLLQSVSAPNKTISYGVGSANGKTGD
jgi:hypothetical protein